MTDDLPVLPDDLAAELEGLTPEAITAPRPCNPDDLTPDHLELIRDWLWQLQHSDMTILRATLLADDQLDQSIAAIVSDHRDIGIDLRDRHTLLTVYFSLQLNLIQIQRDWMTCGDVHTYIHFARPISNLAYAYELLLLDVFGEDAPYFPEEEVI